MLTSTRNVVAILMLGAVGASLGCKSTHSLNGSSGVPVLGAQSMQDPVKTTATGDPNSGNYTIAFGNVAVGLDEPATLVLTNSGTSPLQILSVGAPSDAEFSVTLSSGAQVLSGGSLNVPVDFKPFSKGDKSATLVIQTDSSTTPNLTLTMTGTGVDLKLGVDPQLVDFGTVVVHTSSSKQINLTNSSDLDLTITPGPITGPSAQFYSLNQTTPFVLKANSSSPIQATFTPATPSGNAEDAAAFTLTLSTGAPVLISLQGIAVSTGLQVSPNPLDFNFVQPGQQLTLPLKIQNLGGMDVMISSIAVTDPGVGQVFALANGSPSSMITVPAAQTITVNVTFSPTGSQQYSGELQIASNDNLPLQSVTLKGYGGGAAITCTPTRLDFGTAPAGFVTTLPVICKNTGSDILVSGSPDPTAELTITGFKFAGGNGVFAASIDPASPQGPLRANQTVLVDVTYTPSGTETDQATMTIQSNVTNPPAPPVLALSGQAILEDKCYYSLTPTSLNWGQVKPLKDGATPYTQAFTITNVGLNECLVNGINVLAGSDPAFTMNEVVSQRLSPAGPGQPFPSQLIVPVSFDPKQTGNYAGTVGFTISDPDGPNVRVDLSGVGGDSCFLVKPADLNFGVVGLSNGQYCSNGKKQFVGVNGCQTPVTISAVTLATVTNSPFNLINGVVPVTVAAGQTSPPFTVGFKPTASGSYYSSAQVQTDLQQTSFGVFFNGTAASGNSQTDSFTGQTPTADILWVMDTDDDEPERAEVSKYGADFVAALEADGIDFQIGVTSTDTCPGGGHGDQGRILPCDGCNLSGTGIQPIITQDDPSAGSDLSTLLAIKGVSNHGGCSDEQFFETSYQGLVSGGGATANNLLGFVRPGAYLAVITANADNEDDNSTNTPNYYANQFFSIKGADHPELFSWSYINPSQFGSPGGHQPFNRLPQKIASMLGLVGGVALDTTQPEWYKGILDLWQIVLASNKQFALSGTPDPSTIQIYLDGPPPDQATNGQPPGAQIQPTNPNGSWNWRYDALSNTIQVNPSTLSLQATDVLYAEYTLVCG